MTEIDDFARAIKEALVEYSEEVAEATKVAVEIVAKEVNEEIKRRVSFKRTNRTNEYVKSFRVKTTGESRFNKSKTWFVANGQHRLTHLLENGHATKNGGRTKAYPHIKYGEDLALRRLPELVEEGIKNAGR
ncbi:MAG: hypothetical protein FD179_1007 [Erysipelotrichaceae bacterium]|nr:MAG: hypothetical protein FD179_1007 [Erysipelotrichaceae bacterium]